jgi:hypothetical protein
MKFKAIVAHHEPLLSGHPNYNGSPYDVQVHFENYMVSFEPLNVIAADDPVSCASHGRDNDLPDKQEWKHFNAIAKQKKMFCIASQAEPWSFQTSERYMYGFEVPCNFDDTVRINAEYGNTQWADTTSLEITQLYEYRLFGRLGCKAHGPEVCHRIQVSLLYARKHKAVMVADGDLTEVPFENAYSGVISLQGLLTMISLSELNKVKLWLTDIGNAYLEAYTTEIVITETELESGKHYGNLLAVKKAPYGLLSSAKSQCHCLSDCLKELVIFDQRTLKACSWMKPSDIDTFEYTIVYNDDLVIVMKDPRSWITKLENNLILKLKENCHLDFNLSFDCKQAVDDTLCMTLKNVQSPFDRYVGMVGEYKKKNVQSPFDKDAQPELDKPDSIDADCITKHQSLVCQAQLTVFLRRSDIPVM